MLTLASAKALEPGSSLQCPVFRGLYLDGRADGRHAWRFRYATRDGIRRHPTIGYWPELNIEAARAVCREIMIKVGAGEDPGAATKEKRESATLRELAADYLEWADVHKAPRSVVDDKHNIERVILPALGHHRLIAITPGIIDTFLAGVYDGRWSKTGHTRTEPRPVQANRMRALLSRMFTLAASPRFQMLPPGYPSPVKGTRRYPEQFRKVVATPAQLKALGHLVAEWRTKKPDKALFLELLFATGARVGEIACLRPEMLTGNHAILRAHKTAKRIGDKRIAIPAALVQRLRELPLRGGSWFGHLNTRSLWDAVRRRIDLGDVRLQDARRTFASVALGAGWDLAQIGKVLGHTSPATTTRYAWLAPTQHEEIVETTAAPIMTALGSAAQNASTAPAAAHHPSAHQKRQLTSE